MELAGGSLIGDALGSDARYNAHAERAPTSRSAASASPPGSKVRATRSGCASKARRARAITWP